MKHLKHINEGDNFIGSGFSSQKIESSQKVTVYCRVESDNADGYINNLWFMSEGEAWDVTEDNPNPSRASRLVIEVETFVGSNVHNAALKNRSV